MGKGAKKKKDAEEAEEDHVVSPAWLETLSAEDKKFALSTGCHSLADFEMRKKKFDENTKKAHDAQSRQLWQNERQRRYEQEEEKRQRAKALEEKKGAEKFKCIVSRALAQGVYKAQDWGDGTWWVQLESKTWKEVNQEYYCEWCNKQLSEYTLGDHIDREDHKNRVPTSGGVGRASSTRSALEACGRAGAPLPREGTVGGPPAEEWQEYDPNTGCFRCRPCNKVVDEIHIKTQDHENRLEDWLKQQQLRKMGYPAPPVPYQALVPQDENDPTSYRYPKCLLCDKWIQDDTSHIGTREAPQGTKEHQKYLRNYGPGDDWYRDKVTAMRARWHPNTAPPTTRVTVVGAPKPSGSGSYVASATTRAPWHTPSAASTLSATHHGQALPQHEFDVSSLPHGWESAQDSEGRTYYFNRSTRATQWEQPLPVQAPVPAHPGNEAEEAPTSDDINEC